MIKTKSIYYDDKEPEDGTRILVMRRWPRGIPKGQIDEWRKDLGPSSELLKQWNEGEIAFAEFRERYLTEMQDKIEEVQELARRARTETITLLCHEESEDHCHRKMLKELIEQRMGGLPS
jgi:uncharacterized protein YeaO (DUF488 family)